MCICTTGLFERPLVAQARQIAWDTIGQVAVPCRAERIGSPHRQAALVEIKEAALAAALPHPDRIAPHKLRHAFATHMLANGADLRLIQELLGRADLGSTEIYTHVDTSRSHAMLRDLHPLNERTSAG